MNIANKNYLNMKESGFYISVSREVIRQLIAAGDLPYTPIGKSGKRISKADLDNYMIKRAVKTTVADEILQGFEI